MGKTIENEKGFKILELSQEEAVRAGMGIWYRNDEDTEDLYTCICMHCNTSIKTRIYYIAVLNDCMCEKCYKHWLKEATYYPEDKMIEDRNYEYYKKRINQ